MEENIVVDRFPMAFGLEGFWPKRRLGGLAEEDIESYKSEERQ